MSGNKGEITPQLLTVLKTFTNAVLQSGNIKAIDVSSVDYDPGKSFSLLAGTEGALTIVDSVNVDEKVIPIQVGYNPIKLTKVVSDTGTNVADDLWALF
jgi:hypothetical protein